MATYYYSTTIQKLEFSGQKYHPIPSIHVEATHKNALGLPHGNSILISTVPKLIVARIL